MHHANATHGSEQARRSVLLGADWLGSIHLPVRAIIVVVVFTLKTVPVSAR